MRITVLFSLQTLWDDTLWFEALASYSIGNIFSPSLKHFADIDRLFVISLSSFFGIALQCKTVVANAGIATFPAGFQYLKGRARASATNRNALSLKWPVIGQSLPSQARFFKAWKQSQQEVQKSSFLSEHLNYNMLKGNFRWRHDRSSSLILLLQGEKTFKNQPNH